jgi:hypothetical protein
MTVRDLLAASAIDAVEVLGGPPADPDSVLDTRDFVRPRWSDGRLVLIATPAPDGRIAPFEVPPAAPTTDDAAGRCGTVSGTGRTLCPGRARRRLSVGFGHLPAQGGDAAGQQPGHVHL